MHLHLFTSQTPPCVHFANRFVGEEEGGGVRSGPREARTILLLHIISVRPSKPPLMVRTFLKVYMELGSYFVSARTNKKHHHQRCPRDPHRQ
jgi:hypothetical protein